MSELKIWMNGSLKSQEEAVLPVNSAAVFYGTNVFEGIRAYWNPAEEELFCFRLKEHFARIHESMKMNRFAVKYSEADMYEAVRETLRGNQIREDVHMHMVAYVSGVGGSSKGSFRSTAPTAPGGGDLGASPVAKWPSPRRTNVQHRTRMVAADPRPSNHQTQMPG